MSEPEIIRPGAKAFAVHGYRYGRPTQQDRETLEDAIAAAYWANEYETMWPTEVRNLSGEVVLDESALWERMQEYEEAMEREREAKSRVALP